MNITFVAAECAPFAKTGGLADVMGALPKALAGMGHKTSVILPYYRAVANQYGDEVTDVAETTVPVSWRTQYLGIKKISRDGVDYYFTDNLFYFNRDGFYGHNDDAERFAFFSRAVLETLAYMDEFPDILHCNDWQTGLVPLYLKRFYNRNQKYQNLKTVYTIHNLEYQGVFTPAICEDVLGLPWREFVDGTIRFNDCINYMKTGIVCSDFVTTVSPTYAYEITTPAGGFGLNEVLKSRGDRLQGILNGIDTGHFNPFRDALLYKKYPLSSIEKIAAGKKANRLALSRDLGLNESAAPLIVMVSRLVDAKGFGLVVKSMDWLLGQNVQVVVLGTGNQDYENAFRYYADTHPGQMAVRIGFDAVLAERLYAAADLFLMPSLHEPCGLAQMIAMRYGTLPLVRATGGLKDSVRDEYNGFVFWDADDERLRDTLYRAIQTFENKDRWNEMVMNAAHTDFSWKTSAGTYLEIYKSIL